MWKALNSLKHYRKSRKNHRKMNQGKTDITSNPRTAIVTGAASGIGLATAKKLESDGMRVVLADIESAKTQAKEISNNGSRAIFVKTNVTVESDIDAMIDFTMKTFGSVDVLVNCAGVVRSGTATETSKIDLDSVIDINLKGTFFCVRAAIPVMKSGSTIINVASEHGLVGEHAMAAYCASKGGVIQLTRALAVDHAEDGIRVNCVCPGPVMTPMLEQYINSQESPEEALQQQGDTTLLKRVGTPEEISNVISFLASTGSSFMTGSIIVVDGGATAK